MSCSSGPNGPDVVSRAHAARGAAGALLVALGLITCTDAPTGPDYDSPAAMQLLDGTLQQGRVGAELARPLAVRVLDAAGRAMPRQPVTFHVAAGAGLLDLSASPTTILSDADGRAQARWTLGTRTADSQRVEARLPAGLTGSPAGIVVFTAIALPADPDSLAIHAGGRQSATVGTTLPESLVVRVADRYGNPVPGVPVQWTLAGAAGASTLRDSVTTTDGAGLAATRLMLGHTPGTITATATISVPGGEPRRTEFSAVALAGAPQSFTLLQGARQAATVGTVVPVAPAAQVRDALGNALAGVAVRVEVTGGNGTIEAGGLPAPAVTIVTNDSGIVRAPWRLGTSAGEHAVQLSVEGLPALVATAAATPDAPASLDRWRGDGQTAAPATTLPVTPAVRVTDRFGNGLPGLPITFAVESGAGTVTGSPATTDSLGVAVAGAWTLGPARGVHALRASVANAADLPSVIFSAVAAFTSPSIMFGDGGPAPGTIVGDSARVAYRILSARPLATVQASIGARSGMLAVAGDRWTGVLDLGGLGAGPVTLVITATDVDGRVADLVVPVVLDHAPHVVIDRPGVSAVAAPTVTAEARCVDEGIDAHPTCRVAVMLDGDPASRVEAAGRVTATFRLSPWDLGATLRFVATDSSGQQATRTQYVYASPSGRWQAWAAVAGVPIDAGGGRVLYHAQADGDGPVFGLVLAERSSGRIDTLERITVPHAAAISPHGAIWSPTTFSVWEWRDGAAHEPLPSVILRGVNYEHALLWSGYAPVRWWVRDLRQGTTVELSGSPVGIPPNATLGSDGSVVFGGNAFYYGDRTLMRWRAGIFTELLPKPTYDLGGFVHDGVNVMYTYRTPQPHSETRIGFWRGTPGPTLTAGLSDGAQGLYALAGGWAAIVAQEWSYRSDGITAYPWPVQVIGSTVRTLSPGGIVRDVRRGEAEQRIEGLSPDGLLIFRNATERFAWKEGMAQPESLGPAHGKVLWRDGEWFLLLGREVLRLE